MLLLTKSVPNLRVLCNQEHAEAWSHVSSITACTRNIFVWQLLYFGKLRQLPNICSDCGKLVAALITMHCTSQVSVENISKCGVSMRQVDR